MNGGNLPTTAPCDIGDAARQQRQTDIDIARGSVRLEGFVLSGAVEALSAKYLNGELTLAEHTAAILALYSK